MQRMFGDLSALIAGEDELREKWSDPDMRAHFLTVLEERGYDIGRLEDMRRLIDAKDSDIFDVLAYVRFSLAPKTRHQRADGARAGGLAGHEAEMRAFLGDVLSSYERGGVSELAYDKLGNFLQVRYGSTADAGRRLGEMSTIRGAFKAVQRYLYRA
jgi:type I restriction enzyme R subunit